MQASELLTEIALGEDSRRQFKSDIRNAESLAAEMAAFANSVGGTILIGVADDGSLPGLVLADVNRINQLISNAASQLVRSPLAVQSENIALDGGRLVIVLRIPDGLDKPYFDKNGVIWLKCGSDKRRVNSKEELRRLFQISDQFHADELPTKAGIEALDKLRFRDFLRDFYKREFPEAPADRLRLLQNMNLATDDGKLNLAGVLLFAEQPEWIKPQFVVKAIRYPGNVIHASDYLDTEDFSGPLRKEYDDALAFVLRNLHKVQAGRGVNAPGRVEIPEAVFEELLVNALVLRDYLVSAPIRIFVFDNRVEIISPGHLPNNLTVEKIRAGNSNIRNPILVSYVAKGLLPYHGLGSGITRALSAWPKIDFINDHEACLFTAIVHRQPQEAGEDASVESTQMSEETMRLSEEIEQTSEETRRVSEEIEPSSDVSSVEIGFSSEQTSEQVMSAIKQNAAVTIREMAVLIGVSERSVERNLQKLQNSGRIRRVGPTKGGHWDVVETNGR